MLNLKAVCSVIACCGIVFSTGAQINLLSNDISFRTYNNPSNNTYHYGDLHLSGVVFIWYWLGLALLQQDLQQWRDL